MDNQLSRNTQPITDSAQRVFAQWAKSQQTLEFQDKAVWLNDLANVPKLEPKAYDDLDYQTIRTTVAKWVYSIYSDSPSPSPTQQLSLTDITTLTAPPWLVEQLCLGGMAHLEAKTLTKK